jgi:S1-C subfamily serine protease
MFMGLYAVGCGLGHPPLATQGNLTGFNDIIDNYPYFLSSAATIFGNSGGAVFLDETYEFIGVPSRVAVSISGFSSDAITHLSYFIPVMSIYKFIEDQVFTFIYDSNITSKDCEKERKDKRERDEKMMAIDMSRTGGE